MSAQPDHAPAPPPTAAAQLRARIQADRRAHRWLPAFEREWEKALEDSRHAYDLTPLHEVVRPGRAVLTPPRPSRRSSTAAGDDSDGVDLEQVLRARR